MITAVARRLTGRGSGISANTARVDGAAEGEVAELGDGGTTEVSILSANAGRAKAAKITDRKHFRQAHTVILILAFGNQS
jgi:hypothetical protein